MSAHKEPGSPPGPPADLAERALTLEPLPAGLHLYRIHRSHHSPLYLGASKDPEHRRRWDDPEGSYGVCYLAEETPIAFAETLLRDLTLRSIAETELRARSLAQIRVRTPLHLVSMHGSTLHTLGADASVVHGPYSMTQSWSATLYAHPSRPDGIRYRARHDDSGFAIALFEHAAEKIEVTSSAELLDPTTTHELARWLDRYALGLVS